MRTSVRKIGLIIATAVLGIGVVGLTAPAQADTTWGCPGCLKPHHGR